jgi:transposase-like protein
MNYANTHSDKLCPHCHGTMLVRNGKKYNGAQNYLGKDCGRQFIADHERTYRGCLPEMVDTIKNMLVRGVGYTGYRRNSSNKREQGSQNACFRHIYHLITTASKLTSFGPMWAGKRPRFGLSMLIIALPARL